MQFDEVCDDRSRNNKNHIYHTYHHCRYRNDQRGRCTTHQRRNRHDDLDFHHSPYIQLYHHHRTNNNNKILPIRIGRMMMIVIFILLLITFYLLVLYTLISSWNDTNVIDLIVDLWDVTRMQRLITITFSSNIIKTKNGTLIVYWVHIEYKQLYKQCIRDFCYSKLNDI